MSFGSAGSSGSHIYTSVEFPAAKIHFLRHHHILGTSLPEVIDIQHICPLRVTGSTVYFVSGFQPSSSQLAYSEPMILLIRQIHEFDVPNLLRIHRLSTVSLLVLPQIYQIQKKHGDHTNRKNCDNRDLGGNILRCVAIAESQWA
jgi:hypothetical protein